MALPSVRAFQRRARPSGACSLAQWLVNQRFILCALALGLIGQAGGEKPGSPPGGQSDVPEEQNWTKLWSYDSAGSDTQAPMRVVHTASLWGDLLVIFGGRLEDNNYLNDLWLFDMAHAIASNSGNPWKQVPGPSTATKGLMWPVARGYHTGGVVHVAGGSASSDSASASRDLLLVYGGRVKEAGSSEDSDEVWAFDLEASTWELRSGGYRGRDDGPGARSSCAGAGWGGGLLVMGGIHDSSSDDADFADLWFFNASSTVSVEGGGWHRLAAGEDKSPGNRYQHAAALVSGGGSNGGDAFVVHGGARLVGQSQWELLSDAWIFDLDSSEWTELSAAPKIPRDWHQIVALPPGDGELGARLWTCGGVANVVTVGGLQQYYVTSRVLAMNATYGAVEAATAAAKRERDAIDASAAAAAELGWFEYSPANAREMSPRFQHQMVAWNGRLVLHGGRFDKLSDAQDIYALEVSTLAESQLTAAPADPVVTPQQSIAFVHLAMAMAVIFVFVCVFLSAVRRSIDARLARSLPITTYYPAGPEGTRDGRGPAASQQGLAAATIEALPLVPFAAAVGCAASEVAPSTAAGLPAAAAAAAADREGCPICLQEYESGEQLRVLPCQHLFHPHCIGPWLRRHVSCPMCKTDVRSGSATTSAAQPLPAPPDSAAAASPARSWLATATRRRGHPPFSLGGMLDLGRWRRRGGAAAVADGDSDRGGDAEMPDGSGSGDAAVGAATAGAGGAGDGCSGDGALPAAGGGSGGGGGEADFSWSQRSHGPSFLRPAVSVGGDPV